MWRRVDTIPPVCLCLQNYNIILSSSITQASAIYPLSNENSHDEILIFMRFSWMVPLRLSYNDNDDDDDDMMDTSSM